MFNKFPNFTKHFPADSLKNYITKAFYSQEDTSEFRTNTKNKIDNWISEHQFNDHEETLNNFLNILQQDTIDIAALQQLSHSGVPEELRSIVWKLLLGYLPANKSQQEAELTARRLEYLDLVDSVYPEIQNNQVQGKEDALWDQIYVDVIRTFPVGMESFCEFEIVRHTLCRVLYVYSVVHQRGNYWQGLNELPVPFLLTFASFYANCSMRQLNTLPRETIEGIFESGTLEADSYWCLCRFVSGLQLNGDFVVKKYGEIAQDAILKRFEILCKMVDGDLVENLKSKGVEFVFFAFRWMVCLLTREIPIATVIRLWDSYMAQGERILSYHLYCALSFMLAFADEIKQQDDFEQTLTFLQRIPTENWTDSHAEYLIHCADQIKCIEQFYYEISTKTVTMIVGAIASAVAIMQSG